MHICCMYVMYYSREEIPFSDLGYVPIGLSYVAGALKQAGHTVEAICPRSDKKIDDLFSDIEKKPDIFAVSIPSVYCLDRAGELIKEIKRKYADAKVIAGGLHATLFPESLIRSKYIDAVCIGEGEKAAVEYVRQVEKGKFEKTDNLWIKDADGKILKCDRSLFLEDINAVAMDRDIWSKYFPQEKLNRYFIVVERGCPHSCLYCANKAIAERSQGVFLRYRDIESVIRELEDVKIKFPAVNTVEFNADNMFSDMNYFFGLFERLKKLNGNFKDKFKFEITGNCTAGLLKKYGDIAKYLKEANVSRVLFSLESGSQEIRAKLRRPFYKNEDIINFCRKLKKEKIQTHVSLMYCYPFETALTYKESIKCIKLAGPDFIKMTFLKALPDTEFDRYLKERNVPLITFTDALRYLKMAFIFKISLRTIWDYVVSIKSDFIIQRAAAERKKYLDLAKFYFNGGNFKMAVKAFNKLLKKDKSLWIYGDLAMSKMRIGDYRGAKKDFDRILKNDPVKLNGIYAITYEECLKKTDTVNNANSKGTN